MGDGEPLSISEEQETIWQESPRLRLSQHSRLAPSASMQQKGCGAVSQKNGCQGWGELEGGVECLGSLRKRGLGGSAGGLGRWDERGRKNERN